MVRFTSKRFSPLDVLTVGITALLGLMHLPCPFGGDQTLFILYARKLSQGAELYRDVWDVKQPGIFGFYLLAGKLFGFSEVGVHTLELLYMTGFSVFLILKCKNYFRTPWAASLLPLLTIGSYYAFAGSNHLTKLEPLVGFPIFLSLCWACEASGNAKHVRGLFFLSGLMGGIILLFKLVLLPIPLVLWLAALVFAARRKRSRLSSELLHNGWPILAGVLAPLFVVAFWFASRGNLTPLLYASFKYPLQVATELPIEDRTGTLLSGLQWFLGNFAPLLALAFVGAWLALTRRREVMTVNLVLWVVIGFPVILLQRYSWWEYHYFLLLVPLGILAGKGIEGLWELLQSVRNSPPEQDWSKRTLFAVSLVLMFSPLLSSWGTLGLRLARHRFTLDAADRLRFQNRVLPVYETVSEEVLFLSQPDSLRGDIFVFGDPRYYYLSGRNQAIALNGANPDIMLPGQWREMKNQLAKALPPYIYVATDQVLILNARAPDVVEFIHENYQTLREKDSGTWYVLARFDKGPHSASNKCVPASSLAS